MGWKLWPRWTSLGLQPGFACGFTFYPSFGGQKSRGLVAPGIQCWLVARIKLVCVERALLPALPTESQMSRDVSISPQHRHHGSADGQEVRSTRELCSSSW